MWNDGEKIIWDIVVGMGKFGPSCWIGLESPMDQRGPLPERDEHLADLSQDRDDRRGAGAVGCPDRRRYQILVVDQWPAGGVRGWIEARALA